MPSTFANVATATTDAAIVAARTGSRVRVGALTVINGATASGVTFNSKPAGAGTAITPLLALGASGGVALPHSAPRDNPSGWFTTKSGEGLSATTAAGGSTVGILAVYDYVPA